MHPYLSRFLTPYFRLREIFMPTLPHGQRYNTPIPFGGILFTAVVWWAMTIMLIGVYIYALVKSQTGKYLPADLLPAAGLITGLLVFSIGASFYFLRGFYRIYRSAETVRQELLSHRR